MAPLVESPSPLPPNKGEAKAIPNSLLYFLSSLAGLATGLPFGLDSAKLPAVAGIVVVVVAFMMGSRACVPDRAGIAITAIFGVLLGLIGGYVWRGRQETAPHRDTNRDGLFESKGRITRGTLKPTPRYEKRQGDRLVSLQYCALVSFHVTREDVAYAIHAKRCDLSKSLWKFLEDRAYGGVDIVYLPSDMDDRNLSQGINSFDFDYRFSQELSPSAVQGLRAQCDTSDPACTGKQPHLK